MPGTPGALDGLTVADFTSHVAGPYATKLLADLGARVIKVERPGGDAARLLGPFLGDESGIERSATFQFLNTNKESVVLDLKTEAGHEAALSLCVAADLIVSSFTPGGAQRLGLEADRLRRAGMAPVVTITNFGRNGPYRDYALSDTVLYAMGGEMFSHGTSDREPLKLGGTAALLQGGAMAAVAAMGAVLAFESHGIAQVVDVPLFDVQINSVDRRSSAILAFRFSGRLQERPAAAGAGIAGGIYPVADGFVEVTASFGNYWRRFVEMIDAPELRDPRFLDPAFLVTPEAKEIADGVVWPWMLMRTRLEVWEAARHVHAMVAPLFTGADLYADPVFRERGLWSEIEHSLLGTLPMLGRPYVFEKTPWTIRRPAPLLGQHTASVLEELGFSGDERRAKQPGVRS